jgi:hypothetical protein
MYCEYYWKGNDWNRNSLQSEIIQVGPYKWYACEDRIYCFLVEPCEDRFGSGLKAIEKCRQLLCQTYLEKYNGDVSLASKALQNIVGFSDKCSKDKFYNFLIENKLPLQDNWYNLTFEKGCK